MAKIWIVEDDARIGLLIETAVRKVSHDAVRFVDAGELEKALKTGVPDLLLLDLMLRGKDGYTILREWKEQSATNAIPVIILSARSTESDKVLGLELGAEDYITKPFGVRELQARVQTALRRTVPQARRMVLGGLTLQPDTRDAFVDGKPVDLTYREFELLLYLARRSGQTVTREQLLRDVWGYQFENDPTRTVDYHIKSLRLKLEDSARQPRFIQTVHGVGYRFIGSEGP